MGFCLDHAGRELLAQPGVLYLILFCFLGVQEVPRIEIPLHTLIELVPKPDGKMAEERIKFDLQHESVASYLNQTGSTSLATQDSMQAKSLLAAVHRKIPGKIAVSDRMPSQPAFAKWL